MNTAVAEHGREENGEPLTPDSTQPANSVENRSLTAILISAVGLLLLAGLAVFLTQKPKGALDLQAVVGEEIRVQSLPFGLQPITQQQLRDGRRVALFGLPEDLPDAEEMGAEFSFGGGEGNGRGGGRGGNWRMRRFGGGGMHGKFNANSPWIKLPPGRDGADPWQVALVRYPRSKAEKILKEQFVSIRFQDLSQIPGHGGKTAMHNGYVPWSGYRLPYVRTRHFRKQDKKPVFHDSIRVNLSRGNQALVLYARWRPGENGEIEKVQAILDRLVLEEEQASVLPAQR